MPPNARVIIFEDSQEISEVLGRALTKSGHTVVGAAGSIEELENRLPEWNAEIPGGKQVVALIDNQAPWKNGKTLIRRA